jgi:hypothetical protein
MNARVAIVSKDDKISYYQFMIPLLVFFSLVQLVVMIYIPRKYKSQIKSDPYFRMQFQTMCEKIGVDPLASSKGIWGELLGLGDFYYELGKQSSMLC